MNKYKQVFISLAILTYILSAGVTTAYARAMEYKIADSQRISDILDAFENDDYDQWKRVAGRKNNLDNFIGKEEFEDFITARKLARVGKYEEALVRAEKVSKKLNAISSLAENYSEEARQLNKIFIINQNIDNIKSDIERNI